MPEILPVFPQPHPRTGEPIAALGFRRNGDPIWPIMGGAEDPEDPKADTDPEDPEDPEDPDKDPEDPEELGDKGKQALDRMKAQRNTAKAELREFKDLGLTPAEIKKIVDARKGGAGNPSDGEIDADQIREEARREARAEAAKERVEDKIEAKAAKQFADASDAVAILLRTHDITDFLDGEKVDVEAISEALDDLAETKPHLLAAQGGTKRFGGSADGGARKESRPKQLTRDDLSRMTAEQIVKAKAEGRLADLFAGK